MASEFGGLKRKNIKNDKFHGSGCVYTSIGHNARLMIYQCVLFHSDAENDFVHIASLKPPSYKSMAAGNVRVPELKVYPAGAPIMDDVVLTALMVERIRLEKSVLPSDMSPSADLS